MEELIFGLSTMIIVYLFYLFFVINKKSKFKEFKNNNYVTYLVKIYNLNVDKINMKLLANIIAITNSFIIGSTAVTVGFVDNFLLKMLLAVVILIPLQLIMYHLIGKSYQREKRK
ncbi:MAG: hypothetical protein ACK5HP_01050 [Bacilli bacterium]